MFELICQHRERILETWLTKILSSYPEQTASFWSRNPNPFANPVGTTFKSRAERVFSALLDGAEPGELCLALEDILKIRAVQELTAAESVGFVFLLKDAAAEVLAEHLSDPGSLKQLIRFSRQVDLVALEAFEIFARSRERVFELRVKELKRTGFLLLKRSSQIAGNSDGTHSPTDPGEVQ
ncbi:MAG: RsbRD N-terminal domain-containing protein [Acidobacteriota bacterium]|nr:MAG: RsbRD N-terminal domain-containing protein [Acidobacteriota bacterium]